MIEGAGIEREVTPTTSEEAFKHILGVSEIPARPEDFPESFTLPLSALGGIKTDSGLPAMTDATIADPKRAERGQFITVEPNGALVSSPVILGTSKHVGPRLILEAKAVKGIPLLVYHTDASTHYNPISLFSITDIATYAAQPEEARIFAVSGREGMEVLLQTPQPKRGWRQRLKRSIEVRMFLHKNKFYSQENREDQARILQQIGFRYYSSSRGERISAKRPPLAGVKLSSPPLKAT